MHLRLLPEVEMIFHGRRVFVSFPFKKVKGFGNFFIFANPGQIKPEYEAG